MSWIFYYFVFVKKAVSYTQVRQTQDVPELYATTYEHKPEAQKRKTQLCLSCYPPIPLPSDNSYVDKH